MDMPNVKQYDLLRDDSFVATRCRKKSNGKNAADNDSTAGIDNALSKTVLYAPSDSHSKAYLSFENLISIQLGSAALSHSFEVAKTRFWDCFPSYEMLCCRGCHQHHR